MHQRWCFNGAPVLEPSIHLVKVTSIDAPIGIDISCRGAGNFRRYTFVVRLDYLRKQLAIFLIDTTIRIQVAQRE